MAYHIPTKCEFICAGLSLIFSQIIIITVGLLYKIDYDYYDVNSEQDVIELHELASTDSYRTKCEIAVSLQWLSFPFWLCAIYGMTKFSKATFQDTPGICHNTPYIYINI